MTPPAPSQCTIGRPTKHKSPARQRPPRSPPAAALTDAECPRLTWWRTPPAGHPSAPPQKSLPPWPLPPSCRPGSCLPPCSRQPSAWGAFCLLVDLQLLNQRPGSATGDRSVFTITPASGHAPLAFNGSSGCADRAMNSAAKLRRSRHAPPAAACCGKGAGCLLAPPGACLPICSTAPVPTIPAARTGPQRVARQLRRRQRSRGAGLRAPMRGVNSSPGLRDAGERQGATVYLNVYDLLQQVRSAAAAPPATPCTRPS